MVLTTGERLELGRMAQDAYKRGMNDIGTHVSVFASRTGEIPLSAYDAMMAEYRRWLIDGWQAVTMVSR